MITTLVRDSLTTSTTTFLAQNTGDIGDVSPQAPDGRTGDKILMMLSWLMWGCIIAAVAGIMICGAMLAYEKISGGGPGNASGKLVGGLFGSIVIGGAAGLVNMLVL